MKLQLDTTVKTVKVEGDIKISALIATMKDLFPTEWESFTLQTNVTINNWNSPIYIEKYPQPYIPHYPWYCNTTSADYRVRNNSLSMKSVNEDNSLKSGIFNVETKY